MTPLELRFWAKVDMSGDCWEWLAAKQTGGYGSFRVDGRTHLAHRVVYELTVGPPADSLVCHHCDNPSCVRPTHLFLGGHRENALDMVRKGRDPKAGRKLSPLQREEILDRHRAGESQLSLAKEFGVHRNTTHYLCKGVTWKS